MADRDLRISKLLALVLRHDPSALGLTLDEEGWADVAVLLEALAARGDALSREDLQRIVSGGSKRRYVFDADGARIRAMQGHSVSVDLGLVPQRPPAVLHHGTVRRFVEAIRRDGLVPGARQHVHLSVDAPTARIVGARRGEPVILEIDARRLADSGHEFFLAENGVWLTAHVPPHAIKFP